MTHDKLVEMILEPKPVFLELKVRLTELECKTNMMLILMHHMCISTSNVPSVILGPENLEIVNITNVKIPPQREKNAEKERILFGMISNAKFQHQLCSLIRK
jgi:hypothetical protein